MGREGGREGGSRPPPALPACQHTSPAPGIWAVLGWPPAPSATAPLPSRSPPDSHMGLGSAGAYTSAPTLLGEQPPANFSPGEEERLGLLWGAGNLAQRLIRQANCSQLGAAHPTPHPPSLGTNHAPQLGSKKRGQTCSHLQGSSCPPYLLPILKMPQQVLWLFPLTRG